MAGASVLTRHGCTVIDICLTMTSSPASFAIASIVSHQINTGTAVLAQTLAKAKKQEKCVNVLDLGKLVVVFFFLKKNAEPDLEPGVSSVVFRQLNTGDPELWKKQWLRNSRLHVLTIICIGSLKIDVSSKLRDTVRYFGHSETLRIILFSTEKRVFGKTFRRSAWSMHLCAATVNSQFQFLCLNNY